MSTIGMPPHLLALFQSRPPLDYLEAPRKRKMPSYDGMASCVNLFEDGPPPPVIPTETPKERWARLKREKRLKHEKERKEKILEYESREDSTSLTTDALRTLFVGRISYETTEKKLKREFEQFGPIRKVRLIYDRNGKMRGYGFIEFESDKDMKETYKQADGKKIDGWRVIVDVERARTVPGWLPRRLGGGRGPPRGSQGQPRMLPAPPSLSYSKDHREIERDRDRSRERPDRDRTRYPGYPNKRDESYRSRRSRSRSREKRGNIREYDSRRRNRSRERERPPREHRRDY
ncbi:Rna recognition motif-containing protein [Cardiosporidium cionae]|uniref:Rna recognition motif-containing protein n=1 Tax=Cardiosporidium cionae TaxID=476202 RepID=A0ABQ7JBL3_9APIC|nr:Rna recognition motif-containing protein [Cardiosporidium cionae]|eukprot:KAF8821359.1 Rna recognition motif-containing protein [Cardiosporidium cionae]